MVSVSRFSPLRGFPLASVLISVSGRDMVYTGIQELAYRFWGSTTTCIPRLSEQIMHHSLGETNLISARPLNIPIHSRCVSAGSTHVSHQWIRALDGYLFIFHDSVGFSQVCGGTWGMYLRKRTDITIYPVVIMPCTHGLTSVWNRKLQVRAAVKVATRAKI